MILGQIRNVTDERGGLSKALQKGFAFLLSQDMNVLAPGRYEIDDNCYASVDEYQTEPKSKRRLEAHCNYVDIQYIAAGQEIIGHSLLQDDDRIVEHWQDKDVLFYEDTVRESELRLQAGDYAVFFPWDLHRPCCMSGASTQVKKIVVKVKYRT
jgi:YhcH/YjgK/YiaL family protein